MATIEFVDCGTLNINYNEYGTASLSFTVLRNDAGDITYNRYTNMNIANVNFQTVIMSLDKMPILNSGGWYTWNTNLQGIGI